MSDYKPTLNLPKTDFPMKANLPQREPEWLAFWQERDLYRQLREQNADRPTFILHDGPPYANGAIHIGHAVNKILKDIVNKSKTFSGYNTPYVPGWDCHGLPIELNVEKKIGKAGHKVTPAVFRQACRQYAAQQVEQQREDFKRLGVLAEWEQPYLTMDYAAEAEIIRTLGKIIAKGHLQKGLKPVHWCIDCGSALAEAEVEYQTKISPAIDVGFQVVDKTAVLSRLIPTEPVDGDIDVVVWTTTPWTLPANQAVALHADLDYVLIRAEMGDQTRHFILAKARLEACLTRYHVAEHRVIATFKGALLEGHALQHPFYDRRVPLILAEHVTTDSGTGAVHTAPAHGQEDYVVGKAYDLPLDNPVGDSGCYLDTVPLFGGQFVYKANPVIIEQLAQRQRLYHHDSLEHSYPHCWRHKTPLIFRATPQWFISMEKQGLREQTLAAIPTVEWMPDWGQPRITGMIAQRPDWCISRQRTWGVPIPLFVHRQTGELHPKTLELIEQVAQRVALEGIDAWFELDPGALLGDDASEYRPCRDTLDVWFDSGASYAFVLEQRPDLSWPADLYLEGSDQHRGWFHTALLSSMAVHGQPPYRAVLTHGFAVDDKGRKMSKSLGNVVTPDKVIKSLGADILRLWVAAADYRSEMTVSDEILKRNADAYRRIRNTARYFLANLHDFEPSQHRVPPEQMLALDRWVVAVAAELQQALIAAYDHYQFHLVVQKIHTFCTVQMGGFYLDIIKDRQYTMPANSLARRSAQTALYDIARSFAVWIAPILSFTAEEIWQHLPQKDSDSVFLQQWRQESEQMSLTTGFSLSFWEQIIAVKMAVNKHLESLRAQGTLGSSLDAAVTLYAQGELYECLSQLKDELRFVLITSAARVARGTPSDAEATELEGLSLTVTVTADPKCVRCWHRQPTVGQHAEHPELCARCIDNVMGEGEARFYA